jgi:cytochrome oxidase Cu insertion factor (SCO1/SenC/PrrC family)
MKRLLSIIAGTILSLTAVQAQTTLTNAVDFTVTDVDGNQHNLFSILQGGQYVCIDFFFTTCPPCQATVPYFKQTFQNYGCNTQDVFFISVDYGDTDAECIQYENTYLGGPAGFPVVSGTEGGGDAVCTAYGIGAYPTYILIAPNQSIVEQDMWPISSAASFDPYFSSHQLAYQPCLSGISEAAYVSSNTINVFPNPASDQLTVNSNEAIVTLNVMDASGRIVFTQQPADQTKQLTIDVAEFAAGMYTIEVVAETSVTRTRFVRQ